MFTLPAEQDKLLKQLNDIDALERQGIIPERNNINLFLVILTWIYGILLSLANIANKEAFYVPQIFGFCALISFGLIGAFYNKMWGRVLSALIIISAGAYVTYLIPEHHSELTTLLDGLAIFIVANQFGKKGFIFSSLIILIKLITTFIIYGTTPELENYISSGVIVLTTGVIPIFAHEISKFSRRAKKQEIRSEILALQNQDLLQFWQDFYKPNQSEPVQPVSSSQNPQSVQYGSPYAT